MLPFIDSRSEFSGDESAAPIPVILFFTYLSLVYGAKILPGVKKITPNFFEEITRDFQLPMGPTLSKGTLEEAHLVVLIYLPSIFLLFVFLGPLIFYLRVPILALTPMLPSGFQYHTGRFFRVIKRCASLCPLPFLVAVLIQIKVSQNHPIDRIIYHLIAFGQILLLMGLNIWTFLFVCFVDAIFQRDIRSDLYSKFLLYPGMGMMLMCIWIIAATGRFGEIRWLPSKDHLSHLVPSSIKNATMMKCRWTLLFYRSEIS